MFLSFGARFVTSLSPIYMFPDVGFSKPATILKVVVFPLPDGPRITKNSPSSISKFKFFTASNSPNFLLTFSNFTFILSPFYTSRGHS